MLLFGFDVIPKVWLSSITDAGALMLRPGNSTGAAVTVAVVGSRVLYYKDMTDAPKIIL